MTFRIHFKVCTYLLDVLYITRGLGIKSKCMSLVPLQSSLVQSRVPAVIVIGGSNCSCCSWFKYVITTNRVFGLNNGVNK